MRILSFDTSAEAVQVALLQDGTPVAQYSHGPDQGVAQGAPRQQAGATLLPLIDTALKEQGWEKQSLECLVVGVGPGSFTGIRTGVVTARTLAQALNLPLVPVSLLECFASACELPVAVVLSASRGHSFAAAYCRAPSTDELSLRLPLLDELIAPAYVPHKELIPLLESVSRWAVAQDAMDFVQGCSNELTELPKVKNIAMQQAQIAWNRLSLRMSKDAGGDTGRRQSLLELFPYNNVQPLYLRSPSVTVKPSNTQASHGNENQANAPGRHR